MANSVVIVEDDIDMRNSLVEVINSDSRLNCINAFSNFEDFLVYVKQAKYPDILLTDIGLPGMSGIDGIKQIRNSVQKFEIIILTVFNDYNKVFDGLAAGATGYVLKSTPLNEIVQAILIIAGGGGFMSPQIAKKISEFFRKGRSTRIAYSELLTARENEIVKFLVEGDTYQAIADSLFISIETVRHHVKHIYKKLQVNSRFQVMKKFNKQNYMAM